MPGCSRRRCRTTPTSTTDPQIAANGYIHDVPWPGHDPVRIAGTGISIDGEPLSIERMAPELGEHTEAVLLEAGYSWDDVVQLRADGVIGPPET